MKEGGETGRDNGLGEMGEEGNREGEMGREAMGRGRRAGGGGLMGGGQRGERGKRWGKHMECLGGRRLQFFLTLLTCAPPGNPASV